MSNTEVLTRKILTGYIDAFTGPAVCLSSDGEDGVDFEALAASGRKVRRITLTEASGLLQKSGVVKGETLVIIIKEDHVPVKGEVSFLSQLGEPVDTRHIPYGLLDQNIWLRKLWGSDYYTLAAELDSFLGTPYVADLWIMVEKYMVSSLPAGFSAHTLVILSPEIKDTDPPKITSPLNRPYTFEDWASGLTQAFSQSPTGKLELWMHTQSQEVLEFLKFLDRHLFEKALGQSFFQNEFRAAFWDQWAVTQVRGWYREERFTGAMTYRGVQLGEPAEYENLQRVLAVLKAGVK